MSLTDLKLAILRRIRNDGPLNSDVLVRELDWDEDEVLGAIKELNDSGYISQGVDWDWSISENSVNKAVNHPSPEEALCARSPSEIERMCSALLAYPYASGKELDGRKVARWLLGESDSYPAPRIELRTLFCSACEWRRTTCLHSTVKPNYCPECGTFDSVSVSDMG